MWNVKKQSIIQSRVKYENLLHKNVLITSLYISQNTRYACTSTRVLFSIQDIKPQTDQYSVLKVRPCTVL